MADKKTIAETVKALLKEAGFTKEEVKLGQLKVQDSETVIEFEGDEPKVGTPVFMQNNESEEKVKVPEGSYELESGDTLHVDENGLVAEAPVEEESKEEVEEVMAELTKHFALEFKKQEDSFNEKVKSIEAQLAEMKKGFETQLAAEKKKNEELEAKLEKEPAEKKIVKVQQAIDKPLNSKQRLFNVAYEAVN